MHHELVNILNKIASTCSNEYDINCGGCCFFAALVARELDELNLKYKLVIYNYGAKEIKKLRARKDIRNRNKRSEDRFTLFSGNHYAIMLNGGTIINGDSYEFNDCDYTTLSHINHKDIRWIYSVGNWNSLYHYRSYNPLIGRMVRQAVKKYKEKIVQI